MGSIYTFLVISMNDDDNWRPRYRRRVLRRREMGDEWANGRLARNRLFLPLAIGTVRAKIDGTIREEFALNGISIPIEADNLNNIYGLLQAVGTALNTLGDIVEKSGGDYRKALRGLFRTIRPAGAVFMPLRIMPQERIQKTLNAIRESGIAHSQSSYPSNFVVERVVADATLSGDAEIYEEMIRRLQSIGMKPMVENQNDEVDEGEEDGAWDDITDELDDEPESDGGSEEGSEDDVAHESGDEGVEEVMGEVRQTPVVPETLDYREFSFLPDVLELSPEKAGGEPSLLESLKIPDPLSIALHGVASVSAILTGWSGWLFLPLVAHYPLLGLLMFSSLMAQLIHHLVGSGILRDLAVIITAYALIFSMGWLSVSLAYRKAGFQIRIGLGLLGLFQMTIQITRHLAQLLSAVAFRRAKPVEGLSSGVPAGVSAVQIPKPQASSSDPKSVSDLLVAGAVLLHLIPRVDVFAPALLAIALSVEQNAPFYAPILNSVGLLAWSLAQQPIHRLIAFLLVISGVPGGKMISVSSFPEEANAWMTKLRGLPSLIRSAFRSGNLRQALRSLFAKREQSFEANFVFADNPVRTDTPIFEALAIAAEEVVGIRSELERYIEKLRLVANARNIPPAKRAVYRRHLAFWEGVFRHRMIGFQPGPEEIQRIPLKLTFFPPAGVIRIPTGRGRHSYMMEIDDERSELRELLEDEKWVGQTIAMVVRHKAVSPFIKSRELILDGDRLYLSRISPINDEKMKVWMSAARENRIPEPFFLENGIILPFAISTYLGGPMDRHQVFCLKASPRSNAHALVAQATRGGKTATMLGLIRAVLKAYEKPDLPWRIGLIAIDGKSDLAAPLSGIASHPAILAPPLSFEPSNPYPTVYFLTALYIAMENRSQAHQWLTRIWRLMKEKAPKDLERIIRMMGAEDPDLSAKPTALETLASLIPNYAMVLVMIDEYWGIKENIEQTVKTISVRLDDEKKPVKVPAGDVVNNVLLQVMLKGASAGFIMWFATQSPRKDAVDHPAIRDNANVFRGNGVSPILVQSLLTEAMKTQEAILGQAYQVGGGKLQLPPRYSWAVYMRGDGYGMWDGKKFTGGGSELNGSFYAVDVVYPPLVMPSDLPSHAREWGVDHRATALAHLVRWAGEHMKPEEIPACLRPVLEMEDPILGVREFCKLTLGCRVDMDWMIRLGQQGIVSIARLISGVTLEKEEE